MPGNLVLWPTLTGGEVLDLLGRLRGGGGLDSAVVDRRVAKELRQHQRPHVRAAE